MYPNHLRHRELMSLDMLDLGVERPLKIVTVMSEEVGIRARPGPKLHVGGAVVNDATNASPGREVVNGAIDEGDVHGGRKSYHGATDRSILRAP